jgi:hypothetical protein
MSDVSYRETVHYASKVGLTVHPCTHTLYYTLIHPTPYTPYTIHPHPIHSYTFTPHTHTLIHHTPPNHTPHTIIPSTTHYTLRWVIRSGRRWHSSPGKGDTPSPLRPEEQTTAGRLHRMRPCAQGDYNDRMVTSQHKAPCAWRIWRPTERGLRAAIATHGRAHVRSAAQICFLLERAKNSSGKSQGIWDDTGSYATGARHRLRFIKAPGTG